MSSVVDRLRNSGNFREELEGVDCPTDLIEACKKQRCIPFIGAGFSAQSGLPTWAAIKNDMSKYLLSKAADKVSERAWIKSNGVLEISDRFKKRLTPAQFQVWVDRWFNPERIGISSAHECLVAIDWPLVATTNFDKLLELAYAQKRGRAVRTAVNFEQLVRAESASEPYVLKLHGSVEDPGSLVLTETDYARMAVENRELLEHIEKALFTFKRILFLGFSMNDPEIRSAFLRSRIAAKGYASGDFIVLTDPSKVDIEVWEERGLTVISLRRHSELPLFLRQLHRRISSVRPSRRSRTRRTPVPPHSVIIAVVDDLPKLPSPVVSLRVSYETGERRERTKSEYLLPDEMDQFLESGEIISIIGDAGSGKTTLVHLAADFVRRNGESLVCLKASRLESMRLSLRKYLERAGAPADLPLTVLVDGLDECTREMASGIVADLQEARSKSDLFRAIVTTRPMYLEELEGIARYSLQPLDEGNFIRLAGRRGSDHSRLQRILVLSPSLHGRPLHAKSIGDYIRARGQEPESEADYALWLLDSYYDQEGIAEASRGWIEMVAADLYLSEKKLCWSVGDWVTAARNVLNDELKQLEVTRILDVLTGEDKPFMLSRGQLVPRHRTVYEAMVGRGLSRSNTLGGILSPTGDIDDSSIMIACAIKSMSSDQAGQSIRVVIQRAPWLAARVLLGSGGQSEISRLLLNREFELDLQAAIRHGVAILGVSTFVDFVSPLFSIHLRSPSLLFECVSALETLRSNMSDLREMHRVDAMLKGLWEEHSLVEAKLEWILVPGGYYDCGASKGLDKDEEPVHRVFLNPFRISKYQVTNRVYQVFSPQYERDRLSLDDDMPAVNVTWFEAQLFSRWITGDAGSRLPTEAEWETAARGGTSTRFYWGDEYDREKANCGEDERGMKTVGCFPPNPYGIFDMAGNVYEWCLDWYEEDYYNKCNTMNPTGPPHGRMKVMRGGSWGRSVNAASSTYRVRQVPETRDVLVGFRVSWPQES